jgi:hypothetical protein
VAAEAGPPAPRRGFTAEEWKRIAAVVVFFVFATLFWGACEQAGSTLNLFAQRYTRLEVLGFSFPASWLQSTHALFVILLAPAFAWLWIRLGPRQPSAPAKFALGLFFSNAFGNKLAGGRPGSSRRHGGRGDAGGRPRSVRAAEAGQAAHEGRALTALDRSRP